MLKRARLDRVTAETRRIERDVRAWLAGRRKRDARSLHRARLDGLEGALLGALARLSSEAQLSIDASAGTVYRAAAAQERRLALVDRLFAFFRSKLDQRDEAPLGPTLDLADELVHSLYLQPFRAAGLSPPPPPLAYVEPAFSPRALPRDEPPSELQTGDDVLRAALARLPFGAVGLPPWCEEGPWALAYLAHEIGHHVQFDLSPSPFASAGLVKGVADTLKQAAAAAGLADPDRFRLWSKEIFADAFSVATIGPPAIEAILELERGDDAAMLIGGGAPYPSPAVRLATMSAFASAIGLDPSGALGDVDPAALVGRDPAARSAAQRSAAAYLDAVPAVAAALAARPLAAGMDLAELAGLRADDFAKDGEVARWAEALGAGKVRPPQPTRRGTRRVLAASWVAWRRACAIEDDAARAAAVAALKAACFDALAESREPLTLAGATDSAGAAAIGRDLGDYLLALTTDELGA